MKLETEYFKGDDVEMKKDIRAAPKSPCGKDGCKDHVCMDAYHCQDYRRYLKALRQK